MYPPHIFPRKMSQNIIKHCIIMFRDFFCKKNYEVDTYESKNNHLSKKIPPCRDWSLHNHQSVSPAPGAEDGWLTSYAWTLLVIHFLLRSGLVPFTASGALLCRPFWGIGGVMLGGKLQSQAIVTNRHWRIFTPKLVIIYYYLVLMYNCVYNVGV